LAIHAGVAAAQPCPIVCEPDNPRKSSLRGFVHLRSGGKTAGSLRRNFPGLMQARGIHGILIADCSLFLKTIIASDLKCSKK
jgi:hypothetical protein